MPLVMLRVPSATRWLAPARPQQRREPPPGHRGRRRDRRQPERSGRAGAVARPCRTRADVGAQAQGRLAAAAVGDARSDGVARAGAHSGGRELLRRRRRALEARHRRLRLAAAWSRRRISASMPGSRRRSIPAGRRSCCRACARAKPRRRRRAVSVPAGSQLVVRSTGNVRFDIVRKGGARGRAARCARRFAGGQRGAPLRHQGRRRGGAARRRQQRSRLEFHRHPRPRADHRADQGSGTAGARLAAARLPDGRRLRRGRGACRIRAQGRRRRRRKAGASAL